MVKKMADNEPGWVKKGKDYNDFIGFRDKNPLSLRFLDNGDEGKKTSFTDKETGKVKIVDKYTYKVVDLDNGKEKIFSMTSVRFFAKLELWFPIKDQELTIEKIGEDFDTDYEITPYNL